MPEEKRGYTPSRSYDFQLKIKNLDYTNDLRKIRIVSSFVGAYPIITIDMSLDPNDIILDNIFGKEPMKLSIRLLSRQEERIPLEQIDMELICIDSNNSLPNKANLSEGSSIDRTIVSFITAPRKSFVSMTTLINDIFIGKTPKQIIEEIASNLGVETTIDKEDLNQEAIDQIMIPPTTFYKTIQYLDDNYGIFDGACNLGYCQYDNKVYVMNLTKRMTKAQTFTIYHLSTNSDDTQKILEKCNDGKNFYTYTPLSSSYAGNSKFASMAKNIKHIVKPKDKLFHVIEQKLDNVCSKYGAIAKNSQVDIDSKNDRETYKIGFAGNDLSSTFANARIARQMIGLATVELDLEKDLPILGFMKVGEPVKIITKTVEYVPISGKYLLKASDLNFSRESADWVSTAHLVLCRTNKTI